MKRTFILTVLTVAMLGGVASADRHHGGWGHGGGGWNRGGGGWNRGGSWSGGVHVSSAPVRVVSPRVYVQPSVRVVRRPIYVQRPVIRYHYYDYYQRPAVIAESYPAMDGYYWVNGQWTWTGYEWSWQPGHYEPYAQPQPQYDAGYYDQGYYSQPQAPCNEPGVNVQAGVSWGY